MGIGTHYKSLMRKNWILWKRNLCVSITEILCPIILFSLIVMIRLLIDKETESERSFLDTSTTMYLPDETFNYFDPQPEHSFLMNEQNEFMFTALITNDDAGFMPYSCKKTERQNQDRFVIAISPSWEDDPVVQSVKDSLESYLTFVNFIANLDGTINRYKLDVDDPDEDVVFLKQAVDNGFVQESDFTRLSSFSKFLPKHEFKFQAFDSLEDMQEYTLKDRYIYDDDVPGVCFGFRLDKDKSGYDVNMFFNDGPFIETQQNIPWQIESAADPFVRNFQETAYMMYQANGFTYIQNWIANAILREETGNPEAAIDMGIVPFASRDYVTDDFAGVIQGLLPFFLLLIYILPVSKVIERMVSEKETRARESMKIMGMSDFAYFLSWWSYFAIQVTVITLIGLLILKGSTFPNSNGLLVFLFMWVYGMSLFGFCVFVMPFFSKARSASIFGTMLYFGTSNLNSIVQDDSISQNMKIFASLFPTVGCQLAATSLGIFETSGIGIQWDNYDVIYKNYSFSNFLNISLVSFFLFFILGLYLDKVMPSQYGIPQKAYFFLLPSFWCGSKAGKASKCPDFKEVDNMKKENYEDVSEEVRKLEESGKLLKIHGLEKHFGDFKAVNGVNLKMYQGQIFALLGHNGAGKTTMISMLTGLLDNTKGAAEVFGIDLFNSMDKVRNMMGVCPQHDVLFDNLTPEEHISVFCDFKGFKGNKKEEIKKILKDVDLTHFKNVVAKNLSGGSRRKLSLGIALCGGSKLILLDEPTSGMDLTARRQMWEMLKSYKNDRIIILTTHYMDEADILGDRIGIMVAGKIFCLGPSLFLKGRFGVGYKLTLVKKEEAQNTLALPFLEENLGSVQIEDESKGEITFKIPLQAATKFKQFFTLLDDSLEKLGVQSYGISVTTLEEVFLKVGHGEIDEETKKQQNELKRQTSLQEAPLSNEQRHQIVDQAFDGPPRTNQITNLLKVNDMENNVTYSIAKQSITNPLVLFINQIRAMFTKRLISYKRNWQGLLLELLVPIIIVFTGLLLTRVTFFKHSPEREFTIDIFPSQQNINFNIDLFQIDSDSRAQDASALFDMLLKEGTFNPSPFQLEGDTEAEKIQSLDTRILTQADKDDKHYDYASYMAYKLDTVNHKYQLVSFVNGTSQDAAAVVPQFAYEAVLRLALNNKDFKFKMTSSAQPIPKIVTNREGTANGIFLSFMIAIGFALIPASIISHIIHERNSGLKHQQQISGMSLFSYWTASYLFEMIKTEVPIGICLGLVYLFEEDSPMLWRVMVTLPIGFIPFTFGLSFVFNGDNAAMSTVMFINFVFAGLGSIAVVILNVIKSTYDIGETLTWVFRLIPLFSVTHTINYESMKVGMAFLRPELPTSDWALIHSGGDLMCLFIHFIFWSIFIFLCEVPAIKKLNPQPRAKSIKRKTEDELQLDEDVTKEAERVKNNGDLNIKIDGFRKIYGGLVSKPTLAVEDVSFGLQYGECFCLLGVNGAGKTTTFKALTGEYLPTAGNVEINGMQIKDHFSKVCKMIGYCPQNDAIFASMTVYEHLKFYSLVKGIIKEQVEIQIEKCITELGLDEYRNKPAGSLSGGNKRKLSVAMALLGNPPIILLDEPSAGMDPIARQFMWRVVSQQRKNQSAVVLTTHSMEEALFLSTKIGIMVRGGIFRCFGTAMHIQNKYCTGYEVEVKIKKMTDEEIKEKAATQQNFKVDDKVPFASVRPLLEFFKCSPELLDTIHEGGLGNELWKQAQDNKGVVSVKSVIIWNHVHNYGKQIISKLIDSFEELEIVEFYNDYFKFKVPRSDDKSIGFLFGLVEDNKEACCISEYSVQQTTLEQIFQRFANLEIDRASTIKFTKDQSGNVIFRKESLKRQTTKTEINN